MKRRVYHLINPNITRALDVVVRGVETVGKAGEFLLARFLYVTGVMNE